MWAELAADNTACSNEDASAYVQRGEREQDELRVIPDQVNERSEKDHGER